MVAIYHTSRFIRPLMLLIAFSILTVTGPIPTLPPPPIACPLFWYVEVQVFIRSQF